MDFELGHVVNRSHPVVHLLLALLSDRTVHSFVVSATYAVFVAHVRIVKLLIQNTAEGHARIEFDPGRSQHEVDVAL